MGGSESLISRSLLRGVGLGRTFEWRASMKCLRPEVGSCGVWYVYRRIRWKENPLLYRSRWAKAREERGELRTSRSRPPCSLCESSSFLRIRDPHSSRKHIRGSSKLRSVEELLVNPESVGRSRQVVLTGECTFVRFFR